MSVRQFKSLGIAPRLPAPAAPSANTTALWSGLSLFLSGAACLIAQVIVQKYLAVLFGGMAAPIMYVISFSFIAGLGAGSLIAGTGATRYRSPQRAWFVVNFVCAAGVALFIPVISWMHNTAFGSLAALGAFQRVEWYYVYVCLLQFVTSFLLAAVMGMNYPIAFETLKRATTWERRNVAIFVLVVNTAGAGFGSVFAERITEWTTLLVVLEIAAGAYLLSAFFPLLVADAPIAPQRDDPVATVSSSSHLNLRQGCFFLFVGGLLGFACESIYFRHYGILYPYHHDVFGVVLCIYLLLWAAGVALARLQILSSAHVFVGLFLSIASAGFATLFHTSLSRHVRLPFFDETGFNVSSIAVPTVFFLPALLSGWLYSQVHNEMSMLDTRRVSLLYFSNLTGSFVGGIVAGYLFPTFSFAVYTFVFLLVVMVAASAGFQRPKLAASLSAGLGAWALLVFVPNSPPHLRYYRTLQVNPEDSIDVAEDWTTSCWLAGNAFFVGGKAETPDFRNTYGGYRLYQVGIPSSLRHHERICYIGIGLGVSNGRLARLLPDSRIASIDYSPAVAKFVAKYPQHNDDLVHRPNSSVIVMDGRLAVLLSPERFDIAMDFTNLDRGRGVSALKSVEFLRPVKDRLRENGVYVAVTGGRPGVAALQKVFANVYAFALDSTTVAPWSQGMAIVVATDGDIREMLDPSQFESVLSQDPELQDAVERKKHKSRLVPVKPISGRYVSDVDPCADYFHLWEPLAESDLDFGNSVLLPF